MTTTVHLPDLRGPRPSPGVSGWCAVDVFNVSVPSLEDARLCAEAEALTPESCDPRPRAFDLEEHAVIVRIPTTGLVLHVALASAWFDGAPPDLVVERVIGEDVVSTTTVAGVLSSCKTTVTYAAALATDADDGDYRAHVTGFPDELLLFRVATHSPPAPVIPFDACAITLAATTRRVLAEGPISGSAPNPPLLAVDSTGCIRAAWSLSKDGRALVPSSSTSVDLRVAGSGALIATLNVPAGVRDARFFDERIAVLTPTSVMLFDRDGCPLSDPLVADLSDALGLGAIDDDLVVVQRGTTSPAGSKNVRVVRPDGTELAPPDAFPGRGWYGERRSAAFTYDADDCSFGIDPRKVADGCCVQSARALTDAELAFFRLVSDLPQLRQRVAYATDAPGTVVLGPAADLDPLDAGRPDTVWHRVRVYGDIPVGCTVDLETRATNELLAGDPRVADGWSRAAHASNESSVPVESPADTRPLAGDFMVLASPGRFLWLRLSLGSDGLSTPRIRSIEIDRPREGIARFLPRVFQDSTPDDDFLRRWLALFETTTFDGVAARMDGYDELFDPGTAPPAMLPYLAGWLEMPVPEAILADTARLRRILLHAPEIARLRGTAAGLELIIRLYTDVVARVRESFRLGTPFVLGVGPTLGLASGPVLGCETRLSAEPGPTDLGEATLGCTYLLECDERSGSAPSEFEVLVPAHDVCSSTTLSLIALLVDGEKPAHTRYRITQLAPAGFVVGTSSIVGQSVARDYVDPRDESRFGLVLGNGPPRPKPIGLGFRLGFDSRLPGGGQPVFQLEATVGRTTRVA